MVEKLKSGKNTINTILRFFIYLLTVVIIIITFPKEGKFRYEFQKGSPWKHDNLIAPFDFAIFKLDNELLEERKSAEQNVKLYFIRKSDIKDKSIDKIKNDIVSRNGNVTAIQNKIDKYDLQKYVNIVISTLSDIYKIGIVEQNQYTTQILTTSKVIMVKPENGIAEFSESEFYTLKTAYQQIRRSIEQNMDPIKAKEIEKAVNLDINMYLEPDLILDENTSKKVKQLALDNLSLTRGMIQTGERIIFKGELVDDERFRILESLREQYETSIGFNQKHVFIIIGQSLIIVLLFSILYLFLYSFRPEIFRQIKYNIFILLLILTSVISVGLAIKYHFFNIYVLPLLLLPIIIKTFLDPRTALFVHVTASILTGFIAPNSFEFFIIQFSGGIFILISLQNLSRRGHIFIASLVAFLNYCFVFTAFSILHEGDIKSIEIIHFAYFGINSVFLLLAYPLIYAFEKVFGFLSDVTLMELSDTNRSLLRHLSQVAPGTFQHSMQVANLAENAIFLIGGNPHLARTGALYHDIGKSFSPQFFIENQLSGVNPHDNLSFDVSAKIIIDHVEKGVELAYKHALPEQIIDFIRTHHGTTKVQYFYKSFLKKYPELEIDVKNFTYPGPVPFSKEMAVVMMADSIEAASRSLKSYNDESINNLVDSIINYQIDEKQFDNTNITFKDIAKIKELFKQKLKNIYHTRIEYPK